MWYEHPLYVSGILCLMVVAAVWLARLKPFKLAGAPLLVIVAGALLSNLGLLPSGASGQAVYTGVFTYLAPLSIFILLLEVNLKSLQKAGAPMLLLFATGALATIAGILIAYAVIQPAQFAGKAAPAIAGMYTGTYIGGSINFNAIALHYGVMQDGALFATTTVVDNIIGTPWIIMVLLLTRWLQKVKPSKRTDTSRPNDTLHQPAVQQVNVPSLGIMLGTGLLVICLSNYVQASYPRIPAVLVLTTLALAMAQLPQVKKIGGVHTVGLFLTLIFLGVIGTLCDMRMLIAAGDKGLMLLAFAAMAVLLHGLIVFAIAWVFKADWDIACMASLTNIGGTTTAIAGSEGLNRPDLLLPGLLAGSLGNAAGTYAGFAVATWLSA